MSDDFFIRLERQLAAAELRELNRAPAQRCLVGARRLLPVPLAAAPSRSPPSRRRRWRSSSADQRDLWHERRRAAGDPRGETTLTRPWPAGQTSLSYRFPRDVSRWCRLEGQAGSTVAFVMFPGVSPGARDDTPHRAVDAVETRAAACLA